MNAVTASGAATVLRDVTVITGAAGECLPGATVRLDTDGVVEAIEPDGGAGSGAIVLAPPAIDLHLDVLAERRRPRANAVVELEQALSTLDAELAASGMGTVCIGARFEHEPVKGVDLADALALCDALQDVGDTLVCDWRIHARVELTEEEGPDALHSALERSDRVALISVMDHSAEQTRFASYEAHVDYYARDWGVPREAVEASLKRKRAGAAGRGSRREAIAALARKAGLPLASHDDRTADDVRDAARLGAQVAEFPLTAAAAAEARALGLATVLGAPNAVRGASTSAGNLTVDEAMAGDLCDVLCSDYLPSAMLRAPHVLAARGHVPLAHAMALITTGPAQVLGLPAPRIAIGQPLDAVAVAVRADRAEAVARWRAGRLVHWRAGRTPALSLR